MKIAAFLLMVVCLTSVIAENVTYKIDGKEYEGYYTSAGKNAPLVIIIHDWDGVTEYEVKRAEMLQELGYSAFAIDLFGKGVRPTEVEDKKRLTGELYKDREKMRKLISEAVAYGKQKGYNVENVVFTGYCFGGSAILEYARSGATAKGYVGFHAGLKTPEGQDYSNVKADILLLHGSADQVVPMEDFAELVVALEKDSVPHEIITYGGARHAFSVWDSPRYNKSADVKSWSRFVSFLEDHLK